MTPFRIAALVSVYYDFEADDEMEADQMTWQLSLDSFQVQEWIGTQLLHQEDDGSFTPVPEYSQLDLFAQVQPVPSSGAGGRGGE